MHNNRIYLVGFMGSGKSHLGSALARTLGYDFIDLDQWIETRHGKTINEIFSTQGETAFREMETQALQLIRHQEPASRGQVVATGGGAPCFNGNMELMNEDGITIWLHPSVDTLVARLENEKDKRPLLAGLSPGAMRTFIEHKLKDRTPFYHQASLIITDDQPDVEGLIKQINHASHIQ